MAVRLPPMQALRAFEAAAQEGRSLTRAAESLHVTHGAIATRSSRWKPTWARAWWNAMGAGFG